MSHRLCQFFRVHWKSALIASIGALTAGQGLPARAVEYQQDIVPILTKYCAGCHNAQDREGELSMQSFADLSLGGEHGPVIVAGDAASSRLLQVLTGAAEPSMPPEGEPRPAEDEIVLLRRWIAEGAHADEQQDSDSRLRTPQLAPSLTPKPITALACSPNGQQLAIGRFQSIDLVTSDRKFVNRLAGHPGKVNAVTFSPDGKWLLAGTGITGLFGETWVWDVVHGQVLRKLSGHSDSVYALACSPDGHWLATAGYDRQIMIWDLVQGSQLRTLSGHNGPVFDLAFAPNSRILASASADATVKIWDVESGERMDTLSQPLKEQYSVDISPDGQFIVAGGADNRLRIWRLQSIDQPQINPLLLARYAHEQAVQRVRFSTDGRQVLSVASDRTTKLWNTEDLRQLQVYQQQADVAETFAWQPGTHRVFVGCMDGGLEEILLADAEEVVTSTAAADVRDGSSPAVVAELQLTQVTEQEPNDDLTHAQPIPLPAQIAGVIDAQGSGTTDVDAFRIQARQGEHWQIEVRAARDGSPLDSVVRVLDAQGRPIPRVLLRAVRDSYFTFRGKDSIQTGDFRLQNWEEMKINQLLYADGEVVKLYHYPRGPDSGFNVYPNFDSRFGFFDTTPITHAMNAPCYIVEPHPPGTELPANGLPVFTLYFENDDESQRRWGTDSLLSFVAPSDGEYLIVLEDVRNFHGSDFRYQLNVRPPQPDFRARILVDSLKIPQGSGQKFGVQLERLDGFDGPVAIEFEGLPEWLEVTQPLVVEPGHVRAWGMFSTRGDREVAAAEEAVHVQAVATAVVGDRTLRHELGDWGPLQVTHPATIDVEFIGNVPGQPNVLEIQAGTTTMAQIRVARHGEAVRVNFGKEDAVVNSPHGVFVSNTGLNGVLITENENERTVTLQAEPWVEPTERWVFVVADVEGSPTSRPMLLRVTRPANVVARGD